MASHVTPIQTPGNAKGSVGYKKATVSWAPREGGSVILCHCPTSAVEDLVIAIDLAHKAIREQLR